MTPSPYLLPGLLPTDDSMLMSVIESDVLKHYNQLAGVKTTLDMVKSKSRNWDTALYPRMLMMTLIRELVPVTLTDIAVRFHKDHSSVIHANRSCKAIIKTDRSHIVTLVYNKVKSAL